MFYDLYLDLCKKKNVSPTKAALDIGISKATPSTWKKRGLTPQGDTLNKIASYFGVSTDYLLGQEQKEKPAIATDDELSPQKKYLVEKIRQMDDQQLAALDALIDSVYRMRDQSNK